MTPKQEAALRQAVDAWFRPGGINYVDFKPYMDALREALAEQPAQQQEPVACRDEMCACRGGPCASCPDGEREKELADVRDSRDFYKRRTDELQKAQSQMRDPERTMVCDILANGRLLVPAGGGGTTVGCVPAYITKQGIRPQAVVVLTDGYLGGDWGQWSSPVLWCILGNKHAKPDVGVAVHVEY